MHGVETIMNETADYQWLPNAITSLRAFSIPAFIYFLLEKMRWATLGVVSFGYLTDFFDGFFARKLGVSSDFGNIFDKITDLVLNLTIITALIFAGIYPWWFAYVIATSLLVLNFTEKTKFSSRNPAWRIGGFILAVSNIIALACQHASVGALMSIILTGASAAIIIWSVIHVIKFEKF